MISVRVSTSSVWVEVIAVESTGVEQQIERQVRVFQNPATGVTDAPRGFRVVIVGR